MEDNDPHLEARRALYNAIQDYVSTHEEGRDGVVVTKVIMAIEIQEPLRKHRTLCFRTVDINLTGVHSWDGLGMAASLTEAFHQQGRETTYDPGDAPDNDFESDDDGPDAG